MQTNATFSLVNSNKKCWRATQLATDGSLKFPCCRLVTNDQYNTSSRVMNHVIAANQPLHLLRLFSDIMSQNATGTYDIEAERAVTVAYVEESFRALYDISAVISLVVIGMDSRARCNIFGVPRSPVPLTSVHLSCTDTCIWSRGCPFMTGT